MAEKLSCTFFRAAYRLGGGFEFSACHRPPRRQTLGKFGGAGGAVRSRGSAWTAAACRRCVGGTVPGLPTLRPGGNCLRWPETPTPFHASGRQEKLSRSRGVERGPASVYAVELSQNAVVRGASSLGLDDFLAQRAPVPAVPAHPLRHGVQKLKCAAASLICHNRKSPRLGSYSRHGRCGPARPCLRTSTQQFRPDWPKWAQLEAVVAQPKAMNAGKAESNRLPRTRSGTRAEPLSPTARAFRRRKLRWPCVCSRTRRPCARLGFRPASGPALCPCAIRRRTVVPWTARTRTTNRFRAGPFARTVAVPLFVAEPYQ